MPRRQDLRSICLIGSGPIVIGQACEFDYAGCQALKVLREDGFRTIVVNSNPATIMTDPGFADATYLEPLDLEGVADVLGRERPDALLPTLGGQTGLNNLATLSYPPEMRSTGIGWAGGWGRISGMVMAPFAGAMALRMMMPLETIMAGVAALAVCVGLLVILLGFVAPVLYPRKRAAVSH